MSIGIIYGMKTSLFACVCAVAAFAVAAQGAVDGYVQSGLIGHWDAIDNVGTGVHDANATTWKDLTGRHADMTFPNGTLIGANYYDMKKEGVEGGTGGYLTDVADIATALTNMACTVEVVCDFRSQVEDGTVFCCYVTDPSKRLLWIRSNAGAAAGADGCIGSVNYLAANGLDSRDRCAVDKGVFNVSRTYAFMCNSAGCSICKNVISTGVSTPKYGLSNCDVSKAWVCIGRRYSATSSSPGVADMKIHAVRIYNRVLTAEELSVNASLDAARFFDTDNKLHDCSEYQQSGLIAHWDGIENAGRGKRNDSATTWIDLVGGRAFRFDNGANVGDTYFDMRHADDSSAGGYVTNVAPLAAAIAGKNATVEVVCDFRSLITDGTLVAFCDANNRLLWVRSANTSGTKGCVAVLEYLRPGFAEAGVVNIDSAFLHKARTYEFVCTNAACGVSRNGEYLCSAPVGSIQPDADNTWLSIGCKVSSTGVSVNYADAKIHAIRVYNRPLSAEEQQANAILDRKRFVEKKYRLGPARSGFIYFLR